MREKAGHNWNNYTSKKVRGWMARNGCSREHWARLLSMRKEYVGSKKGPIVLHAYNRNKGAERTGDTSRRQWKSELAVRDRISSRCHSPICVLTEGRSSGGVQGDETPGVET